MAKKKKAKRVNYHKKCDELWPKIVKLGHNCLITTCNNREGSNAHHLLEKSTWTHFRYVPNNGVEVCYWHHTFADDIRAHGTHDYDQFKCQIPNAFDRLLQQERNHQWQWRERNKTNKQHRGIEIDYEATYRYLRNILNDLRCGLELKDLEGGKYFLIIDNETKEFIS